MNELNIEEMYEVEGGAMVSELDKGLGDGGGTLPFNPADGWTVPSRYKD